MDGVAAAVCDTNHHMTSVLLSEAQYSSHSSLANSKVMKKSRVDECDYVHLVCYHNHVKMMKLKVNPYLKLDSADL